MRKKSKTSEDLRNVIAAAILLPYVDRSTYIDVNNPQNLLLKMPYYHQLGDRDWFKLFQETVEKDTQIESKRIRAWGLGVITHIKYDPIARQAFNWLYMKADESGAVTKDTKDEIVERFNNLVMAYGGAAICNVFTRHESALKKVLNWRTGYFFEHALHEVYSLEQILKIKKADLDRANPSLVKRILVG